MTVVLIIIVVLLVALLVGTGIGKIARAEPIENNLEAAEVPRTMFTPLGTIELAGAAGILIGLKWKPLGVVASACLLPYFAGAMMAHVRAGDKNIAPAGGGFLLSVAALALFRRHMRTASPKAYRHERTWP